MNNLDTLSFEFGGHRFLALPNRSLFWPEENALLVADTHFGKDSVFRRLGVPVPMGTDFGTLETLGKLLDQSGARKLWILGDFLHGEIGAEDTLVSKFSAWRESRSDVTIAVTNGNHDRQQIDRSLLFGVEWVPELSVGGLTLRHDPDGDCSTRVVGGHLHPMYRLREGRTLSERVPVFWIRERSLVLPAFSAFTGGLHVRPAGGDGLLAALDSGAVWLKQSAWNTAGI